MQVCSAVYTFSYVNYGIAVIVLLLGGWVHWRMPKGTFKSFFRSPDSHLQFHDLVLAFWANLACAVAFILLFEFFSLMLGCLVYKPVDLDFRSAPAGLLIGTILVMGMIEEIFFRGYLLRPEFLRNPRLRHLGSALLFGLAHGTFFPQLYAGFIFNYLRSKGASLWTTWIFHVFWNFFVIIIGAELESSMASAILAIGLILGGLYPVYLVTEEYWERLKTHPKDT